MLNRFFTWIGECIKFFDSCQPLNTSCLCNDLQSWAQLALLLDDLSIPVLLFSHSALAYSDIFTVSQIKQGPDSTLSSQFPFPRMLFFLVPVFFPLSLMKFLSEVFLSQCRCLFTMTWHTAVGVSGLTSYKLLFILDGTGVPSFPKVLYSTLGFFLSTWHLLYLHIGGSSPRAVCFLFSPCVFPLGLVISSRSMWSLSLEWWSRCA